MIPRQLGRVLFYVLLLSTVVPSAWSQTPEIDPQALVGRWSGSWIGAHQSKHSGKYYLTIERVEGQKVYGRREITGRYDTEGKITGRLSGNQLTFSKTELTIDGDAMNASAPAARSRSGRTRPSSPKSAVPLAQNCSTTLQTSPSYCLPCQRTPSSFGSRSRARMSSACSTSASQVRGGVRPYFASRSAR